MSLPAFPSPPFPVAAKRCRHLSPDFPGGRRFRYPHACRIDGLQLFSRVRQQDEDLPVILVTGHGDIPMAVKADRRTASTTSSRNPSRPTGLSKASGALPKNAVSCWKTASLRKATEQARDDLPLIGQTPAMERLRHTLRQIADTDVDVLLMGETGSGKEVVASLLHRWSRRGTAISLRSTAARCRKAVIESELFGHEPGAFTGAQKKRIGRIEHASGGTLFLDEIESMPPATQVQMLRVLEMREVTPLGTNEVRPVDLRVVAAPRSISAIPASVATFVRTSITASTS